MIITETKDGLVSILSSQDFEGFDCCQGFSSIACLYAGLQQSLLDLQRTFSCLTVIMEAFQSMSWLATAKPKLYSSMLQLLCVLASDEATGSATLYLLRQQEFFSFQLDLIACSSLPSEVTYPRQLLHIYKSMPSLHGRGANSFCAVRSTPDLQSKQPGIICRPMISHFKAIYIALQNAALWQNRVLACISCRAAEAVGG